ncbi:MAG: hypothetical protein R2860_10330 [Desulfobacterales bacterium]
MIIPETARARGWKSFSTGGWAGPGAEIFKRQPGRQKNHSGCVRVLYLVWPDRYHQGSRALRAVAYVLVAGAAGLITKKNLTAFVGALPRMNPVLSGKNRFRADFAFDSFYFLNSHALVHFNFLIFRVFQVFT